MAQLKPSLSTIAAQKINNYINEHHLTAGDKLPIEPELMKYCDVSRSTLREAVHRLQYSGVVVIKQGSGTYVKQPVQIHITNPLLRKNIRMIEHEVIDELMDADVDFGNWLSIKELLAKRNQLLTAGKIKQFIDVDVSFHTQIVDLTGNQYLAKWYRELIPLWIIHLNETMRQSQKVADNIKYHDQLFNALVNKNRQLAIQMIEAVGNQV